MMIPRSLKVAAVALVGVAGIAAGAAWSTSAARLHGANLVATLTRPTPAPGSHAALCQDFVKNLAATLKVTVDQLNGDFVTAADRTIDDQVASGKITAKQAAALKVRVAKRISDRVGCAGLAPRAGGPGIVRELTSAAASALGITPAELRADFKKGMTLHQIAGSRGVSEAQFRAGVLKVLKPKMDAAVKAGRMTQKQEDAAVARIESGPIPFWDTAPKHP